MKNLNSMLQLSSIIKRSAIISVFLVIGMLAIFISTGIGHDPLQYIHSVFDYDAFLKRSPSLLKLSIGLDNAFILFYSIMFLAIGSIALKQNYDSNIIKLSIFLPYRLNLSNFLDDFQALKTLSLKI